MCERKHCADRTLSAFSQHIQSQPCIMRRTLGTTLMTSDRTRIVVVDDEPSVVDSVALGLRREGYEVQTAGDGPDGLRLIQTADPELVILDVMLPVFDGVEVLRRLRAEGRDVPVLLLTARVEIEAKLAGFAGGADDYLTKPFRLEELLARCRALTKRRPRTGMRSLSFADLTLRSDTREVLRGERRIDLTPREFDLLRCFLEHPRRVFHREQLIHRVWEDFVGDTNVVEVYVRYLRKKLGPPEIIQTVRGVGYALREEP